MVVATSSFASALWLAVAPPTTSPHGQTYAEWAEDWHSWVLSIEDEQNPLLELFTGETSDCTYYQSGDVWFLAGLLGGGEIERECTIDDETAMFFPVVNYMWFPYVTDPPPDESDLELQFRNVINGAGAWAKVDGVNVVPLYRFHFHTRWFRAWMPENNMIDWLIDNFDPGNELWGEGWSQPHFNDGIYLMVEPLDVGDHTIEFGGFGGGFHVTYDLTVVDAN
jgi:hypothetical protein